MGRQRDEGEGRLPGTLLDLCRTLSEPTPNEADTTGTNYAFQTTTIHEMELFSGLIGALIGSVISLCGTFYLVLWQRRRDEKGAIRALHQEVVFNATELQRMASGDSLLTDLSRLTWDATRTLVATRLGPGDFWAIAVAYGIFNACEARIVAVRLSGRPADADDLELWGGNRERLLEATSVLQGLGYSESEYQTLKSAK